MDETKKLIKKYILEEFLPGEDPAELTNSTPLITGGILDSLAMLRLTNYLEEQFSITVAPHELSVDYLNTLDDIAKYVHSKKNP